MTDFAGIATETPWWADNTLVNGVFKGGGAKGVAYAGALRAFREAGFWFGGVAGASAGANTATLIAAGLTPEEIEIQVPIALSQLVGSVPVRLFSLVRGSTSSLFESSKLGTWLEALLNVECRKRQVIPSGSVCFEDLFAATGLELYVVAMDLASGTPLVFSHRTTPWVEVSLAVTSSCAIPGAFPAGRVVFHHPSTGAGVHQLVDGGTFANYPTFVFKDQSFQHWIGCDNDAQRLRPTVGFVLGQPERIDRKMEAVGFVTDTKPRISKRFDIGPTYTAESTGSYAFGSILSNDWARLVLIIAITVWAGLSIEFFPQGVRLIATWLHRIDGTVFPLVVVGLFVVLILTAGLAFLSIVGLISISRMVADTLIPAGQSAIGVATEVVPWSGSGDSDILLVVPHTGLTTTSFAIAPTIRNQAVQDAYVAVSKQLADPALATKLGRTVMGTGADATPAVVVAPTDVSPWILLFRGTVMAAAVAVGVGGLGWAAVNAQASAGWFWQSLLIGVGSLTAAIVGMVVFAKRAGHRAAAHARVGIGQTLQATGPAAAALAAALVCFAAGMLVSGHAATDRERTTLPVTITSGSIDTSGKEYRFTWKDSEFTFRTTQDFALGERIYVKKTPQGYRVANPLEGWPFALSITLEVFGLGLFVNAFRASSWARRSNRLSAWVTNRMHPSHSD